MTQLSNLLTDDSRSPLEKLRRPQLQKILRNKDIKFDISGPATDLRKLVEGNGIDVMNSNLFAKIQVQDENGVLKEVLDPVHKPHATEGKNIDYDAIIEAKAKQNEAEEENVSLKNELNEVKAMLAKLTKEDVPKENDGNTELQNLKEQYKEKFGHYPRGRMKPETLRAKING